MKLKYRNIDTNNHRAIVREIKEVFEIYRDYYGKNPSIPEIAEKLNIDEFSLLRFIKKYSNYFEISKKRINNRVIPILDDIIYEDIKKPRKKSGVSKTVYMKPIYDSNNWLLGYILDSFDDKNSRESIVNILDLLKIDYSDYGFELNDLLMEGFFIPVKGVETLKKIFKFNIKTL